MKMHKIEVDNDVYTYLESKAKGFDTPNRVLRRELLGHNDESSTTKVQSIPQFPVGTPKALEEILQVIYLIRVEDFTRSEATHSVAQHHGVATQTIIDKYTRQLGLTASEFDGLLVYDGQSELKSYLNTKFMGYENLIKEILG
ncbi:MAG: hypothetical protein GY861_08215 [bacterium]|nr:hypothetical protein [bacterium]